jgi:hypothetical protein
MVWGWVEVWVEERITIEPPALAGYVPVGVHHSVAHGDCTALQVDVVPAEAKSLRPAHPGERDHPPQRLQPVPVDMFDEGPKLPSCPWRSSIGPPRLGRLSERHRVAVEYSLPHGEPERSRQQRESGGRPTADRVSR